MSLKTECDWGRVVRTDGDGAACPREPVVELSVHVEGPDVPAGLVALSMCKLHAAKLHETPWGEMEYRV